MIRDAFTGVKDKLQLPPDPEPGWVPPAPQEEKFDDTAVGLVIAKTLCRQHRNVPCMCVDDPGKCIAARIWAQEAMAIVFDLRTEGMLK